MKIVKHIAYTMCTVCILFCFWGCDKNADNFAINTTETVTNVNSKKANNSFVSGKYLLNIEDIIICAKSNGIYYKENITSKENKIVNAENVSSLLSDGETVYYVEGTDDSSGNIDDRFTPKKVYKTTINSNKSDYVFTSKGQADLITMQDNCIYYLDITKKSDTDYQYELKKYDINSNSSSSLIDKWSGDLPAYWIQNAFCLENTIYVTDNDCLCSYDISNKKYSKIISSNQGRICDTIEGKVCFEYTQQDKKYISLVDAKGVVETSAPIPLETYDLQIIDNSGEYALFFNTEGSSEDTMFDLYKIDLKSGNIETSNGEAGSYKFKNYLVTRDLSKPENIYFLYNVGLYDESSNRIIKKKHDEFEINITKPMWIIDGYIVDWEFNTYKIYDEVDTEAKSDKESISSDEAVKIALKDLGESNQYSAIYEKTVQYDDKDYYLINIRQRVDDGNGRFHHSHIGYTLVSMDGADVKNAEYDNANNKVYVF